MKKIFIFICLLFVFFITTIYSDIVFAAGTPTSTAGTPRPSATFTPTVTPSMTPTTTLMPLPAITLIFPAVTATYTPTITPEPLPATETPRPPDITDIIELPPRLKVLMVFVVVLWIILASFVIIYIRQLR